MKKILSIAWKDARMRFSSWAEWLFFLILPIVFTVVLAGGSGVSSDNRVRLVVVDQAETPLSAELITALENSESVRPELLSLADAEEQIDQRRVSAILIIPDGFDQSALLEGNLQLEMRQQPNNINALIVRQAVQAVIQRVGSAAGIARQSLAEAEVRRSFTPGSTEEQDYFDAALAEARSLLGGSPDRITEVEAATPDQIEYDPAANSSAGQIVTWVFIPLIGLSELFAYERQKGTLRRILTTPTRKGTYLFGTVFGQVLLALLQMALLVGFGVLVMRLNWVHDANSLAGLSLVLLCGALAAAALGTMLGTFVKTAGQANGLSIMLGMVMALLGGCWYPLELFPTAMQSTVRVLPTTWAMQGLLDIVLRGRGLVDILPEAGVLLGFAAVFFTIGVLRFRYE